MPGMTIRDRKEASEQMRAKQLDIHKRMMEINDIQTGEHGRDLTEAEETELRTLSGEYESLGTRARNIEAVLANEAELSESRGLRTMPFGQGGQAPQFRNFGEFTGAVYRRDPTIQELRTVTTQSGGIGTLIPTDVSKNILMFDPETTAFVDGVITLEPGESPDAPEQIPVLNQGADGTFAGIQFYWPEEGGDVTTSEPSLRAGTWTPHECIAAWTISKKVLRNAPAYNGLLEVIYRKAMNAQLDYLTIRGDGRGKPLGIRNAPCKVTVARTTANYVKWTDVVAMEQRVVPSMLPYCRWLAGTTVRSQITGMVDDQKRPVYGSSDVSEKRPNTLDGIPVKYTQNCAALGSEDDLMLVAPPAYLLKRGYGPAMAISEERYAEKGLVLVMLLFNLDGQPWADVPLTLDDGNIVSPFVALK